MSENERLARIETSYEHITHLLTRLDSKVDDLIDEMRNNYVPRSEFAQVVKRIEELEKTRGALPTWAGALLSFLTTLALFLAGLYFKR